MFLKFSGPDGAPPGALIARALSGRVVLEAREGARLSFGRNRPEVDLSIGEDDLFVSRKQGELIHQQGWWWLNNTGRRPIDISRTLVIRPEDDPIPLAPGYTTLLVNGSGDRKHLLEIYVVNADGKRLPPRFGCRTVEQHVWPLNDEQRLVLTVLGQRYLRREPDAKPLGRQHVADILNELSPGSDEPWNVRRVDSVVLGVRAFLHRHGVPGLTRDEVGEPVGTQLSHNLLVELAVTTDSLKPSDLDLVDRALDS